MSGETLEGEYEGEGEGRGDGPDDDEDDECITMSKWKSETPSEASNLSNLR